MRSTQTFPRPSIKGTGSGSDRNELTGSNPDIYPSLPRVKGKEGAEADRNRTTDPLPKRGAGRNKKSPNAPPLGTSRTWLEDDQRYHHIIPGWKRWSTSEQNGLSGTGSEETKTRLGNYNRTRCGKKSQDTPRLALQARNQQGQQGQKDAWKLHDTRTRSKHGSICTILEAWLMDA